MSTTATSTASSHPDRLWTATFKGSPSFLTLVFPFLKTVYIFLFEKSVSTSVWLRYWSLENNERVELTRKRVFVLFFEEISHMALSDVKLS